MPPERFVEGVILAAGASSRAGAYKPALPIGGKPMVGLAIEGMRDLCQRIIVVGGHDIARLRGLVEGYAGVECVENPLYRKGMFTSVKAGLAAVRAAQCFLTLADIPLVPPDVYQDLLAANAEIAVPAFRGRKGHPICLSRGVIARILAEPDDSSLREVIAVIGCSVIDVDAEEILLDLDTPEDYERIRQRFA
ncbi:MAG TPA: NTP transferase domain-containing protein [Bacteroidota bacterium]